MLWVIVWSYTRFKISDKKTARDEGSSCRFIVRSIDRFVSHRIASHRMAWHGMAWNHLHDVRQL